VAGLAPHCLDAADVDDDGALVITDPIYLLNFLFLDSARMIPPPHPWAGKDPTADQMGCIR